MPKTVKRTIKTARPVSQSELLTALKNAMGPIFEHFEEKLAEGDGKISLHYGINPMELGE